MRSNVQTPKISGGVFGGGPDATVKSLFASVFMVVSLEVTVLSLDFDDFGDALGLP